MNTRRQFLVECSKVAALAVAAAPTVVAGATARPTDPMALASFRQALQTIFVAHMDAETQVELQLVRLQLASTRSLGKKPFKAPDRRNERFSLLFRGPLDGVLGQDTYSFEHKRMGTFPMFIVPRSDDKKYRYYEAVFNRSSV